MMLVVAVESTALAAVGYDDAQELLQLEFCGGAIYHYVGVPAAVHGALLCAPSKGNYFNRAIRGHFAYRLGPSVHCNTSDGRIAAGYRR